MKNITSFTDYEILKEYERRFSSVAEPLKCAKDSFETLRKVLLEADQSREHFAVAFLDGQNAPIKTEILFSGSITTSAVYPREIIKKVLEYNSAYIVLGHNHPSGTTHPSSSDKAVTNKIKDACASIDVEVLDHIIIGKDKYASFADLGLL